MTVCTICFPFIGDSVGGSQISAAMLIGSLDRLRYLPIVVLHEPGPLSEYFNERNIEFEYLPIHAYVGTGHSALENARNLATTTPILGRFLKRRKISIVHTQDGRMHQTWGLPARFSGTKFVLHQRSMYAPSRMTHIAIKLASQVICNSKFVRESLPLGARASALAIENPFDTDIDPPNRTEARRRVFEEIGLSADGRIIAFIGNLTMQKRPEVFLRAAAAICNSEKAPIRFLIFGRDRENLQPWLMALANELGIGSLVNFMNFRDPIAPWLAASDLLLAPEVDEAFGRTLVEAMLVGTPVIASNSGGHCEVIESETTGILTPSDDAMTMAAAALSLLADPGQRKKISYRARRNALERYAVQAHAAVIMGVYDRLRTENSGKIG